MPKIELNNNEALVLIEFLLRFSNDEKLEIEHEAERQVLYDLCALLESEVPEILVPKYKESLTKARDALVNNE